MKSSIEQIVGRYKPPLEKHIRQHVKQKNEERKENEQEIRGAGQSGLSGMIKKGKSFHKEIVRAYVEYIKQSRDIRDRDNKPYPPEILDSIDNGDTFGGIFERAKPNSMSDIKESDDPSMGGIGTLVSAVSKIVFNSKWAPLDRQISTSLTVEEFSRYTRQYIGYCLNYDEISEEDAYKEGLKHLNEPDDFLEKFAGLIKMVNPNCIHCAFDDIPKTMQKIGIFAAFGITDEAYESTLRGEIKAYEYLPEHMLDRSNNIVLHNYAEMHHPTLTDRKRRQLTQTGFLSQIALLLDEPKQPPFRFISYGMHETNTKRLKKLDFYPAQDEDGNDIRFLHMNKIPYNIMYFDSSKKMLSDAREARAPLLPQAIKLNRKIFLEQLLTHIRDMLDRTN